LRLIVSAATYQRAARALPKSQLDDKFYSHALARPLPPEVLLDAIRDATGSSAHFPEVLVIKGRMVELEAALFPQHVRAVGLYTPQLAYQALGPLAPCPSAASDCPAESSAVISLDGLTAQLHWINGQIVNDRIADLRSSQ